MTLYEYLGDWMKVIDRKELSHVLKSLEKEYHCKLVTPSPDKVFKAFHLCSLENLRVIFIGQDPYPQKGVATGILFGNSKNVSSSNISPSLKVIKEAAINFEIPHNTITFDHSLESWAEQGILMINSALTAEVNKTGSHVMLWRGFMTSLLRNLSFYNTALVYVLFGKQAQTFEPYINMRFNHIIKVEHHP